VPAGVIAVPAAEPAAVHGALRASDPADGAALDAAPPEMRLEFTQAPVLALTRATLTDATGRAHLLADPHTGASDRLIIFALPVLGPGDYAFAWRTAGRDGHAFAGTIRFTVTGDAGLDRAALLGGEAATAGGTDGEAATAGGTDGVPLQRAPAPLHGARVSPPAVTPSGWLEPTSFPRSANRWVAFAALLGLIGAVSFRYFVVRRLRRDGAEPLFVGAAIPGAAGMAFVLGLFYLGSVALRLVFQTMALAPEAGVGVLLLDTGWGRAWLYDAGWAIVAAASFGVARRGNRLAWVTAAAAVIALGFAPALGGHAAAAPRLVWLAVLADGAHVLGAGAWLGTLLLILTVGLRATLALEPAVRHRTVAAMIRVFSPAALACAGLVVASGVVSTALRSGSFRALWYSGYGSVLGWKLILFAGVLLLGLFNWRKVRPRLGTGEVATDRLRRTASFELLAAAAVLVLTAVLVATPPPVSTLPVAAEEVPQHEADRRDAADEDEDFREVHG
jgi:copper transport protein